jgi:hypothetical protein
MEDEFQSRSGHDKTVQSIPTHFEQELPSVEKAKLDLTDKAKKKQHKAVKKNQKAMMQLALSF